MEYFWYYHPERNHPPKSIVTPDELQQGERLAIACTQTSLSPSRQRGIVREWCRMLPKLEGVRLLWLNSRVPQALFDAACQVPNLEGLYIKWSGIKQIEAIADTVSLRYFHLGSSPSVESIKPLADRTDLEWLGLENLKQRYDLSPLEDIEGLVGLSVQGSMWTTQYVKTLAPISRLRELTYLSIINLRADDGTLCPLFTLRNLRRFNAARWWDPAEVEEIKRLNPNLSGTV